MNTQSDMEAGYMSNDPNVEMTESMKVVLDWFADQPCRCATVGHIVSEVDLSRQTVWNNLQHLIHSGHAVNRHKPTGEYMLLSDPRED